MDLLLISRDALENSIIGNLLVAMEAKKGGADVGILFTQEALASMAGGAYSWSPLLQTRNARTAIAKALREQGLPTYGAPSKGWPYADTKGIIKAAKEAGVALYACPTWAGLLGLGGKLPPEITEIDKETAGKLLGEAKRIIGSF